MDRGLTALLIVWSVLGLILPGMVSPGGGKCLHCTGKVRHGMIHIGCVRSRASTRHSLAAALLLVAVHGVVVCSLCRPVNVVSSAPQGSCLPWGCSSRAALPQGAFRRGTSPGCAGSECCSASRCARCWRHCSSCISQTVATQSKRCLFPLLVVYITSGAHTLPLWGGSQLPVLQHCCVPTAGFIACPVCRRQA